MATIGAPRDSRYLGRNRRHSCSPSAIANIAEDTATTLRSSPSQAASLAPRLRPGASAEGDVQQLGINFVKGHRGYLRLPCDEKRDILIVVGIIQPSNELPQVWYRGNCQPSNDSSSRSAVTFSAPHGEKQLSRTSPISRYLSRVSHHPGSAQRSIAPDGEGSEGTVRGCHGSCSCASQTSL